MEKNIKIARVFGIDICVHYSWFFIFALLAYGLATGFFPLHFPADIYGLTKIDYWAISLIASLLLFVSVLLHELSHSLVAKARKIGIHQISLFFFGGIAHMDEKGMTASTELLMALAGPLFSFGLAAVCYILLGIIPFLYPYAILFYLARINLILAIFNMVPGFPLDGGRVFRALIWLISGNYKKATYIASKGGKFIGGILVFFGIFNMIKGMFGGLWLVLIGAFLYILAEMSYEQVVVREFLFKVPVRKIMLRKFASVKPDISIDKAISQIFINAEQEAFPVVQNKKFLGIIKLDRIKELPIASRAKTKIKSVMYPPFLVKKIAATTNAYDALVYMLKKNLSILPVLEKGKIVGVITREAIIRFIKFTISNKK